jgi:hypothetical protein
MTALSPPTRLDRALGGLQAGVAGAAISMVLMCLASRLDGKSFWTIPNLMSGLFYGYGAIRPEFGMHTVAGLAVHWLNCSLLGIVYAQVVPLRRWMALWGPLCGSLWYYLWDGFFWRKAFPPFALYSKRPSIFAAYVLVGLCVGLYSIFARSNGLAPGDGKIND